MWSMRLILRPVASVGTPTRELVAFDAGEFELLYREMIYFYSPL
jgi:hypothetical protein